MTIAVSASVATDNLMTFSGKFSEQLLPDHLDHISLSFLVDGLDIHRGGVAGNICYALGVLGQKPVLMAAVGQDFTDYRQWLESHGVDCSHVYVSETAATARFTCTTDKDLAQIASFYPGALSESAKVSLKQIDPAPELVLIGASAPDAMLQHTREAKELGIPFAADPSQQLTSLDKEAIIELIDGAYYLFSNEYELGLIQQKTGMTSAEIDSRVTVRVTTLGERGAEVVSPDGYDFVPALKAVEEKDPTGVGDAFRAGFLSAKLAGLSWKNAAQLGALVAVYVVETVGTQEWTWDKDAAYARFAETYGEDEAKTVFAALAAAAQ